MCMEDVKIGRNLSSQVRLITVPADTITTIAAASPDRYSMIVSNDSAANFHLTPSPAGQTGVGGITLTRQNCVVNLTLDNCGSMLQQSWVAFSPGVSQVVCVIDNTLTARTAAEMKRI